LQRLRLGGGEFEDAFADRAVGRRDRDVIGVAQGPVSERHHPPVERVEVQVGEER
jgi:hypothetical protein